MPSAVETDRSLEMVLVSLLLAASLACRGDTDELKGAIEASEASEPEVVEVAMEVGPGGFDLPETRNGLAELSSYKTVLTMAFEGTRAGAPEKWTARYEMLYSAKPAARQLTIRRTGSPPDSGTASPQFMAEMNGAGYELDQDGRCLAVALDSATSLTEQREPAGLLIGVFGAEEAGQGHYRFDERALTLPGLTKATGELWVAPEGGHLTRYVLTSKGDAKYFGESREGSMTWDYELTDVNRLVRIALPEDCSSGMVDAPLLPNATEILKAPGLLKYATASSVAEAAAFYREQLPVRGWKPGGQPVIGDSTAFLDFGAGDEFMTIVATAAQPGTKVRIFLSKPPRR